MPERHRVPALLTLCLALWWQGVLLAWSPAAHAAGSALEQSAALALGVAQPGQASSSELPVRLYALEVQRTSDSLLLTARMRLSLPPVVHSALMSGIPIHFVAEAEISKPRWYWSRKKLATAARYARLSYLPLTRRWRLAWASAPVSGSDAGHGLGRYYDSLDEALDAAGRIVAWPVAGTDVLTAAGGAQTLRFRYRLDSQQLPRTLQIGDAGKSQWDLGIERRIDLAGGAQETAP